MKLFTRQVRFLIPRTTTLVTAMMAVLASLLLVVFDATGDDEVTVQHSVSLLRTVQSPDSELADHSRMLGSMYRKHSIEGIERRVANESTDANVELIVLLPTGPVLVRSSVSVDGQPFRSVRRNLLKRLEERLGNSDLKHAEQEQSSKHRDFEQLLKQYTSATNRMPNHDELDWLLSEQFGHDVLWLRDPFQNELSRRALLCEAIDSDRDGVLTSQEYEQAETILTDSFDQDNDGSIGISELSRSLDGHTWTSWSPQPVWFPRQFFDQKQPHLRETYPFPIRIENLPRIEVDIEFNTQLPEKSTFRITSDFPSSTVSVSEFEHGIDVGIGGGVLAVSVVQSIDDLGEHQLSIGAVPSGEPLMTLVNRDADDRLVVRELRSIPGVLGQLDENQDSEVTKDEVPQVVRLSFGWGPTVHRQLGIARSIEEKNVRMTSDAPQWFTGMDTNRDSDLSRDEFIGSDDAFQSIDANQDGLISVNEAQQARSE